MLVFCQLWRYTPSTPPPPPPVLELAAGIPGGSRRLMILMGLFLQLLCTSRVFRFTEISPWFRPRIVFCILMFTCSLYLLCSLYPPLKHLLYLSPLIIISLCITYSMSNTHARIYFIYPLCLCCILYNIYCISMYPLHLSIIFGIYISQFLPLCIL